MRGFIQGMAINLNSSDTQSLIQNVSYNILQTQHG